MSDLLGKLLVVDDNEMNRDMLSRRLERQGHTVRIAENGRQALELIRAEPFDLVLLDIMMPEMNGYQVLEELKNDPALRHIPVIMISAVDEIESVVRCIELGADDYLPKPFNPVLLKARLGASLEKKRMRDQEHAYLEQIEAEKRRADDLLHVILPDAVVEELKSSNAVKPRRYDNVAVMFCDIVEFTSYCDQHPPEDVIPHLQQLVETFEELSVKYHLQKIKTVGDAFMTTAGLLEPRANPVLDCVRCGLEMVAIAPTLAPNWHVRVGVHVGPVMAGVVGRRQYLFDIIGDTVNTAARVEALGVANAVNVSGAAWQLIQDVCRSESRGLVAVKGKGELEMFRVDGFKEAASVLS
jgi:CheY-like chemotaxis protein